jgi:hypothetical protein
MKRGLGVVALLLLGVASLEAATEGNGLADLWGLTQGLQWFARGGPVMYPILACSIIGLAVFLERIAFLRRKHLLPQRFVRSVRLAWQQREFDTAWRLCQQQDVPLARILRAGLLKVKAGPQEVERAIERIARSRNVRGESALLGGHFQYRTYARVSRDGDGLDHRL